MCYCSLVAVVGLQCFYGFIFQEVAKLTVSEDFSVSDSFSSSYNGRWTGSGSMSCRRTGIAWSTRFDLRSPRRVRFPKDPALCLAWTAWSSASNTSWRTKTPPTNSAIMFPPKMANAVLMPPQRATGKMGGWNICTDWLRCDAGKRLTCEFFFLQSNILCRACSQECHGDAGTDEETAMQPLPWDTSVSAQWV